MMFAEALRKAGVPFDLHIYQKGSHGIGLSVKEYPPPPGIAMHPWSSDCIYWLKEHDFAR
jgi:hypothetical protein